MCHISLVFNWNLLNCRVSFLLNTCSQLHLGVSLLGTRNSHTNNLCWDTPIPDQRCMDEHYLLEGRLIALKNKCYTTCHHTITIDCKSRKRAKGGVNKLPPAAAKFWPLIGRDMYSRKTVSRIDVTNKSQLKRSLFVGETIIYFIFISIFLKILRTVLCPWHRVPPEESPWRQIPVTVCGACLYLVAGERPRVWEALAPAPATLPTTHLWSSVAPALPQHPRLPHLFRISALEITLLSTGP